MSFNPESYEGFSEFIACPYCGSDEFDYGEVLKQEFGISSVFQTYDCKCLDCRKHFILVEIDDPQQYGVMPWESYTNRPMPTDNRKRSRGCRG